MILETDHRLILLVGEEEILRRRKLGEILLSHHLEKDDFDLESVDADSSEPSSWFGAVCTIPFLAQRRTLVVRHLLRCDPTLIGTTDLSKLPPSALLILVADSGSGTDEKLLKYRKEWEKVVTKAKGLVIAFDPDPSQVKTIVKNEATRLQKAMSDRAIDTLIEMTGGGASRAIDEMEKLANFTGTSAQISEDDVRNVVTPSREWNVFKMVNSMVQNQPGDALKQLKILVSSSARPDEAAFTSILPQLSRQLRLLYQARICVEAKCSPSNAPGHVLSLFPSRPNIATASAFQQGPAMKAAQRLTLSKVSEGLQILSDCDARLKGALNGYTNMETLERMVLELTRVLSFR